MATKKKTGLKTLYGVRTGNGMSFYEDKGLTKLKARNPYHYYMKNRVITLNGWPYDLKVVKAKRTCK